MKYLVFKFEDGFYIERGCNDEYLSMVSEIFDEDSGWVNAVKQSLLDQDSQGIIGNKSEIDIKGNCVLIMPQFVDDPEEYAIEIDRNVLLELIEKWQALASKETPEIYFIRRKDGSVEIMDHLPEE